ncbi:phage tail protein [Lactobacillus jensenii]|uniref:Phage tail protein n=1 Tax=Lactobacillus mulieris TaxID=2508708 RepID=A0AAP3GY62_9LACO|nr:MULTISPECIES: phage tail protein [Lactobacillus]MCF1843904.1 phage tail protein [Lactobacillus jensenii]MCW8089868.1 phage tail protein [Lactobacillus jensenii]MCW8105461.1 phage tail protein [Lactobacillus mulieris]MCZ3845163.1 phage tail protein [Lactobacillus mulieris]MCZ3900397.1 phage tail protein [Lactobacillus mulieris]
MKKIKLGTKTYNLELTLNNLKDFGMLPSKVEDNTAKLAELIAALRLGDAFTLCEVLEKLLAKDGLTSEEIEELVSKDKNLDTLFDDLVDFFSTAPLTKRMMKKILPTLDNSLKEMDAKLGQ